MFFQIVYLLLTGFPHDEKKSSIHSHTQWVGLKASSPNPLRGARVLGDDNSRRPLELSEAFTPAEDPQAPFCV